MSSVAQGVILAIVSAFVFGFYMAPRKGCSLGDLQFPGSMAIGIVFTIAAAAALSGQFPSRPMPGQFLAFLGGLTWGLGTAALAASVRLIGLSRATPIKDASTIPGVLIGAILFHEIPPAEKPLQFSAALIGSALIVCSALVLQITLVPSNARERRHKATGIALAILSCLCHALYLLPTGKSLAVAPSVLAVLFPLSLGILLMMFLPCLFGSGVVTWIKQPLPAHARAWLSGALWATGQILLWHAINKAGIAVPWGLAGLNNPIAIAYGIIVFKEIHVGRHPREIAFGVLACLVGTFLLTIAKL